MLSGLLRIACSSASIVVFGCSSPQPVVPVAVTLPTVPPSQPEAPVALRAPEPITIKLDGGCMEAKAAYVEQCAANPTACADPDPSQHPGVSGYVAVLNHGTYLNACAAPPTMAVKICAAIRGGRAIAVTVVTAPGNETVGTCIGRAVQALAFPASPQLDITSTTFDAQ